MQVSKCDIIERCRTMQDSMSADSDTYILLTDIIRFLEGKRIIRRSPKEVPIRHEYLVHIEITASVADEQKHLISSVFVTTGEEGMQTKEDILKYKDMIRDEIKRQYSRSNEVEVTILSFQEIEAEYPPT